MTQYDSIATAYATLNAMDFRPAVEGYTLWKLLGALAGKSVLDVACGDGLYTRHLAERGARVTGVDISTEMIRIAQRIEDEKPLGIEYRVDDIAEMPVLGSFDIVTAIYLLHYAPTREHIARMCSRIHANLKPDGQFVTFVVNPRYDPKGPNSTKYGFTIHWKEGAKEGDDLLIDIHGEPPFSFHCHFWSEATYEQALRGAGFREITWVRPECSPDHETSHGEGFWSDYLTNPHCVFLHAKA